MEEEPDVWSHFERSVAYVKDVASLYESAFGCRADGPSRKTVTKAHLDEAHNQAQQALELLASNLLNASMTIVHSIEKQVHQKERHHESEANRLKHKMLAVRQTIRDRQAALDQEAIHKFYSAHKASQMRLSAPVSLSRNTAEKENDKLQHQLKLSLAPEKCMQ
uniref:Uncharacterized protein n=1 Tax=Phytophthora ramorum TaxID=164328 RepID=H3GJZ9_PHYRM